MAKRKVNTVLLDDLVAGRLPQRVVAAIAEVELTVEEVADWQRGKPAWRLSATSEELVVEVQLRLPIKRVLALLGALAGAVFAVAKFAVHYGPAVQDLLGRLPFGR
jgi:hypothetical protein